LEAIEKPNTFLTVRKLRLVDDRNNEMRTVTQIHTTGWPDKSTPEEANLFHLLGLINNLKSTNEQVPIVVHCSAGIGRTGTFMALYFLSWLLDEQARLLEEQARITLGCLSSARSGISRNSDSALSSPSNNTNSSTKLLLFFPLPRTTLTYNLLS
jgi:hypothetical protein